MWLGPCLCQNFPSPHRSFKRGRDVSSKTGSVRFGSVRFPGENHSSFFSRKMRQLVFARQTPFCSRVGFLKGRRVDSETRDILSYVKSRLEGKNDEIYLSDLRARMK